MKSRTKKLVLSCAAFFALSALTFGIFGISPNVTAKADSPIVWAQSASIRLAKEEGEYHGIRFESSVTKDFFEAEANKGAIYGTLICPADYLGVEGNALFHDDDTKNANGALYIYDENTPNKTEGNQYAMRDLVAKPEYDEDTGKYYFKGSITNVNDQNLARPFAARSYVAVSDGNGGYTYTYSDVYSRAIYSVATHAVADTEEFAKYTTDQQSYLNGLMDKVSEQITAISVSVDKTGAVSTTDEVNVTASVTVDTKHYDGDLDIAPKFTANVDGVASESAIKRADANVYTLTDLGKYTLTPYVGNAKKTTAENIALDCNVLSIFTKAGEIKENDAGKLVNPYITSANGWVTNNQLVHKNATVGNVTLDGVTYENVYSYTGEGQSGSLVRLTDTFLQKNIAWKWFVFDLYAEVDSTVNATNTQTYFRYNGNNFYVMGKKGTFACEGYTGYIFNIDANGNAIDAPNTIETETYNKWTRIAIQFNDVPKTEVGWFFNLSTAKYYLKNIYLTTNEVPYTVELSGIDESKAYAPGDTINLTATAYKDGAVVENANNVITVDGAATLNGNVLTVGNGDIKVTVTNKTMNALYPVSRTYTVHGESWENLTVTGIDTTKTYAYNEIIKLSAMANKVGESEAQTVVPVYTVTEGSAVVWQDEEGQWYAKPGIGQSVITASFGGAVQTIEFNGDAETIMLLGGATEEGVSSDGMLQAYFKNFGDDTSYYTYEKYNGRYAVNYTKKADSSNGLAVEDAYAELADVDGYLYIDMYYETQSLTYFFINGNQYFYFFSSYNDDSMTTNPEMKNTDWQWYDMGGTAITQTLRSGHHAGRWLTLEIKLQDLGTNARLVLNKYPGYEAQNMYISSVVISKTRLIEEKQAANAEVLHILDSEAALENYWMAGVDSQTKESYSEFTWVENVAGRGAVKYHSLTTDSTPLLLDTIYKTAGYDLLISKYNYMYLDFYYEEGGKWASPTIITDFQGSTPYLAQYANSARYESERSKLESAAKGETVVVDLPFDYQWYIDANNDGVLEPLADTDSPMLYYGVWVTLEICIPETLKSHDIWIEKYPGETNEASDLYISNVRLSKNSLTGIVTE